MFVEALPTFQEQVHHRPSREIKPNPLRPSHQSVQYAPQRIGLCFQPSERAKPMECSSPQGVRCTIKPERPPFQAFKENLCAHTKYDLSFFDGFLMVFGIIRSHEI